MRNVLVHNYFEIDQEVVWGIVQNDLPPLKATVEEILALTKTAGGDLAATIDLFDMYEGKGVPEGKKSVAFHIVYQANNKTLTNQEADALQTKIIKTLEENPGWEVRD